MKQFHKGDWVRVAKDLGPSMSHFTADCEAIVIGSYADQYGGGSRNIYTLHLKGEGQCSWYDGSQLKLIEPNRKDKLKAWKDEAKAERKQKSNLNWVFANGPAVAEKPSCYSIQALAKCFGLTNLWGQNGEGITYYSNVMATRKLAEPYLKTGDKAGWLARCKVLRGAV